MAKDEIISEITEKGSELEKLLILKRPSRTCKMDLQKGSRLTLKMLV